MTFVVLPASIPEIREVYDAYFAAFEGELVTEVLFPWDVKNKEFREHHTNHTLGYWHKDSLQYTFKCIDTESGSIVGMSLWDVYWKERSEDERRLPVVDWLHGQQKERAQNFIRAFWEKKEALVGGRKHVYCHVVAVLPNYQRRGIGPMLTKPGIDIAEQLQVPLYLEATDIAVKMYSDLGFEELQEGVLLGPEIFGGRNRLEAPIMVKMPTSSGLANFGQWVRRSGT